MGSALFCTHMARIYARRAEGLRPLRFPGNHGGGGLRSTTFPNAPERPGAGGPGTGLSGVEALAAVVLGRLLLGEVVAAAVRNSGSFLPRLG
jgi:hypothetical protein